jgi:hypothetical protein
MDNEIEVMRIYRVPPMGKLVVVAGERRYHKLEEIEEPAVRQRVKAAVAELIVFTDGYEALVKEGLAPPLAGANDALPESMNERQAAFLASLQRETKTTQQPGGPEPVSPNVPGRRGSKARRGREPAPINVVEQLDILLQKHLAASPKLAHRNIRLEEDPAGGMRIQVDGTFYARPTEIEDVQIRTAIRNALKEWDEG